MLNLISFTGGIADTNGYFLEWESARIVVDAPEGMADWLTAKGATVDVLLLTHQHFDHVMDAAEIQNRFGAQVFAFAPFSRDLTLERLYAMGTGGPFSVDAFTVDTVLADAETASFCGNEWELMHIPGHSPDSLCFFQPELGIVFGGDVLFLDGVGRTDFPNGSSSQLIAGIKSKLLQLPDATQVLPGHGPATTIGREREENPFLD
jgi:glyoxylase-like metal-dependent hydrolase (beta-lactamase superfamily II)